MFAGSNADGGVTKSGRASTVTPLPLRGKPFGRLGADVLKVVVEQEMHASAREGYELVETFSGEVHERFLSHYHVLATPGCFGGSLLIAGHGNVVRQLTRALFGSVRRIKLNAPEIYRASNSDRFRANIKVSEADERARHVLLEGRVKHTNVVPRLFKQLVRLYARLSQKRAAGLDTR